MSDMKEDMDFEQELDAYASRGTTELIKFLARQHRQMLHTCNLHNERLAIVEARDKRTYGVIGGIGALLGAAFIFLADYILKKV